MSLNEISLVIQNGRSSNMKSHFVKWNLKTHELSGINYFCKRSVIAPTMWTSRRPCTHSVPHSMNWNLSNVPWSRLWNCILAWKLPLTVDPSQRSKDVQGLTVGPSASRYSRMTQFHRDQAYDVWEVVPPFMQDGTYLSMNSATFGPLTSQPPCDDLRGGGC